MIKVARLNLGFQSLRYNTNKLMQAMGWLNLQQTLEVANSRLTHQLVNLKIPELLSFKFDQNPPDLNGSPRKKPKFLELQELQKHIFGTKLTKII